MSQPVGPNPRTVPWSPRQFSTREIARIFDVPPWVVADLPRPKFSWLRWKLRRVWRI